MIDQQEVEELTASSSSWRQHFYTRYDPADKCDDFSSRCPYLKRTIEQFVPKDPDTRILDLGCGKGTLLCALRRSGYTNLTGVDLCPSQIAVARSFSIAEIEESDYLEFLSRCECDLFDVIITFDVIEHLTRADLMKLGGQIRRVLSTGGRWIIHAPNAAGIFGNRIRYADATHEQAFTPESIRQWAEKLGFYESATYEDKPVVHGVKSLLRRGIWEIFRTATTVCLAAETGQTSQLILSQNLTAVLTK
jgi:2-polyprenyl-3-methyl-5-hydroxy-6-metoxy-1,4-benzoquinol methylase